jgi:hypothetical protein
MRGISQISQFLFMALVCLPGRAARSGGAHTSCTVQTQVPWIYSGVGTVGTVRVPRAMAKLKSVIGPCDPSGLLNSFGRLSSSASSSGRHPCCYLFLRVWYAAPSLPPSSNIPTSSHFRTPDYAPREATTVLVQSSPIRSP